MLLILHDDKLQNTLAYSECSLHGLTGNTFISYSVAVYLYVYFGDVVGIGQMKCSIKNRNLIIYFITSLVLQIIFVKVKIATYQIVMYSRPSLSRLPLS